MDFLLTAFHLMREQNIVSICKYVQSAEFSVFADKKIFHIVCQNNCVTCRYFENAQTPV